MVKKKIEEAVENVVEDIKEEANETAGVITVKRWQVAVVALSITLLILLVTL